VFANKKRLSHYVPGWWQEAAKRETRDAKAEALADLLQ
jgi:hypothetical protein